MKKTGKYSILLMIIAVTMTGLYFNDSEVYKSNEKTTENTSSRNILTRNNVETILKETEEITLEYTEDENIINTENVEIGLREDVKKMPYTNPTIDVFENVEMGEYGVIYVDGLLTRLYGCESNYDLDASYDHYIDMENAAPVYRLPSGVMYIPDHNFQGFDKTLTASELKIKKVDETVTTYERVIRRDCYITNDWVCEDGFDIYFTYPEGELVTQTCVDDYMVAFVVWKIKN